MSLVPQFLTILHHSAKISVLNNRHAKFQGQTRNASFRSNRKSLLETKFTLSNFYFATYKNTQELIGNTSGLLEAIIRVKFWCR